MNLLELVMGSMLPSNTGLFSQLSGGKADSSFTIVHPGVITSDSRRVHTATQSHLHSTSIAMLAILRQFPRLSFHTLYSKAIEHYGFPKDQTEADFQFDKLHHIHLAGGIWVSGQCRSGVTLQDVYDNLNPLSKLLPLARFILDEQGLERIDVLEAVMSKTSDRTSLMKYFPNYSEMVRT